MVFGFLLFKQELNLRLWRRRSQTMKMNWFWMVDLWCLRPIHLAKTLGFTLSYSPPECHFVYNWCYSWTKHIIGPRTGTGFKWQIDLKKIKINKGLDSLLSCPYPVSHSWGHIALTCKRVKKWPGAMRYQIKWPQFKNCFAFTVLPQLECTQLK